MAPATPASPATVVPAVSQPRAAATARAAHTGTGAAEASATAQAPVALSGAAAAAIQHAAGVIRGRAASAASQAAAATVTATSQQSVALPTAPIVHIVRPGENLSSIAAANGIDVGQILYFNAIPDPNHIVAGQRLVLWSPP